jgi:VanZ family protein
MYLPITKISHNASLSGTAKKITYALPALLFAAAIFYISSLEKIKLPLEVISYNDLLFHAAAYFFFGLTLMLAAYPWNGSLDYALRVYLILGLIGILYGVSDEIHQSFVPNRTCTISDLLADSVGVILALLAAGWLIKKKIAKSG